MSLVQLTATAFSPFLLLRDEAEQHDWQHELRQPCEEDRAQQHREVKAGRRSCNCRRSQRVSNSLRDGHVTNVTETDSADSRSCTALALWPCRTPHSAVAGVRPVPRLCSFDMKESALHDGLSPCFGISVMPSNRALNDGPSAHCRKAFVAMLMPCNQIDCAQGLFPAAAFVSPASSCA